MPQQFDPPNLGPGTSPPPAPLPSPTQAPTQVPTQPPHECEIPVPGNGKHVLSVEIVGHPINEWGAREIHALHLSEVITYSDHTQVVVGFFPRGEGPWGGAGEPLYASTRLSDDTPANYAEIGRSHYRLPIVAVATQSLDQFVAKEIEILAAYNRHPMRYDFDGNTPGLGNSNAGMANLIRFSGRRDVANLLIRDLEPSQDLLLHETNDKTLAETASFKIGTERLGVHQWSPGVGNSWNEAQMYGRAPTPSQELWNQLPTQQGLGAFGVGLGIAGSKAREIPGVDRLIGAPEKEDPLLYLPPRNDKNFHTLWNGNGASTVLQVSAPLKMSGTILSADAKAVVQDIGSGQTMTYRTDDLLHGLSDPHRAKALADLQGLDHKSVVLTVRASGFEAKPMTEAAREVLAASAGDAQTKMLHIIERYPDGRLITETINPNDAMRLGPVKIQDGTIVQEYGSLTTTYRIDELLAHTHDPERTRQFLEMASQSHENVWIGQNQQGMVHLMDGPQVTQAREHERSLSMGRGHEMG